MSSASTNGTPKLSITSMKTSSPPASTAGMTIGSGHGPEGAPARGAEILPGLLDRDVDRLERRQGRKDDEREQRHGEDDGHPRHAVDRGEGDADVAQQARDDAGAPEQQHERIGRDEGRQHKRQRGQRQQQPICPGSAGGRGRRPAARRRRWSDSVDRTPRIRLLLEAAEIETARQHAGVVREA